MESGTATQDEALDPQDVANIEKIKVLLKSKSGNDTQKFAGLALLKSVLDNSPRLQANTEVIFDLWTSMDGKFVSRLIKTGSKPSSKGKDTDESKSSMLQLGVYVLHTFAILLPETALGEPKFTDRIPALIPAVLHSSDSDGTTETLLQLLLTLASTAAGAQAILQVEDLSPLTESASTNPKALDILRFAFLNTMGSSSEQNIEVAVIRKRVDETVQSLTASFKGTDAVTFLSFLGTFLRQADPRIIPENPSWLQSALRYIQTLVTSRPTPEARAAYTIAAAALLQAYPEDSSKFLFSADKTGDKPFGYLFINLLLIDIRSSAPMLLEQLNNPEYQASSTRIASALDVICIFIGFLVRCLEDESLDTVIMPPDNLLKLRKGISETLSIAIEFLRDRWDAAVSGAMGLHPDARTGKAETVTGSHRTLGWDSATNPVEDDPLTLAAIRALALWLREDDNDQLRREALGLMDVFMDLYKRPADGGLDFRSPILVGLEGLMAVDEGREGLLKHDGWKLLSQDILETLRTEPTDLRSEDTSRGLDATRVLFDVVEQERAGTAEEWMNLITAVAAWNPPEQDIQQAQGELQAAVLQLSCAVLARASPGLRSRYKHSISAIAGVAERLRVTDEATGDSIREVQDTLASIRIS